MEERTIVERPAPWLGYLIFCVLLLTFILVPFALFGAHFERMGSGLQALGLGAPLLALLVIGLLAADILLPVPSSVVATASGMMLGFGPALLVAWAGLTLGNVLGYWLGHSAGHAGIARLVGRSVLERSGPVVRRYGLPAVVMLRPVPVLAEASIIVLGAMRTGFGPALALCSVANLGLAALYVATGALSVGRVPILAPFAASIVIPAALWLGARALMRRKTQAG